MVWKEATPTEQGGSSRVVCHNQAEAGSCRQFTHASCKSGPPVQADQAGATRGWRHSNGRLATWQRQAQQPHASIACCQAGDRHIVASQPASQAEAYRAGGGHGATGRAAQRAAAYMPGGFSHCMGAHRHDPCSGQIDTQATRQQPRPTLVLPPPAAVPKWGPAAGARGHLPTPMRSVSLPAAGPGHVSVVCSGSGHPTPTHHPPHPPG